ncbi:hypothetical protein KUV57_13665 [Epibacterium sp. DP7N7-1]|nr:hypothetical protein [Epibacterium sp. DP7N7-1]
MDRKDQLKNVSFGGAWSEQIPRRERLAAALAMIEAAPERTIEEDLREDIALEKAIRDVSTTHPKGADLKLSWERAIARTAPEERYLELSRLARLFQAWQGH